MNISCGFELNFLEKIWRFQITKNWCRKKVFLGRRKDILVETFKVIFAIKRRFADQTTQLKWRNCRVNLHNFECFQATCWAAECIKLIFRPKSNITLLSMNSLDEAKTRQFSIFLHFYFFSSFALSTSILSSVEKTISKTEKALTQFPHKIGYAKTHTWETPPSTPFLFTQQPQRWKGKSCQWHFCTFNVVSNTLSY